jgi:hypothetical protein
MNPSCGPKEFVDMHPIIAIHCSYALMTQAHQVCDVMCTAPTFVPPVETCLPALGSRTVSPSVQRRVVAIRGRDTLTLSHAFNHLACYGLGGQTEAWAPTSTLSKEPSAFRVSVRLRYPRLALVRLVCRCVWYQLLTTTGREV